jgi:hypothetical protein
MQTMSEFTGQPARTTAPNPVFLRHIAIHTPTQVRGRFTSHNLVQMDSPVSPHLAAQESPTVCLQSTLPRSLSHRMFM